MIRLAGPTLLVAMVISCASSRRQPGLSETAATSVTAAIPRDAAIEMVPMPLVGQDTGPALGPGKCHKTFDCDDTARLPPVGHRWGCEKRRCVLVRLPNLAPAAEPTPAASQPRRAARQAKARR